jgi:hypothetical protein
MYVRVSWKTQTTETLQVSLLQTQVSEVPSLSQEQVWLMLKIENIRK